MLAVVRIHIRRKQALDGTCKASVEAVDENGFENGSFKEYVGFSCRRIGGARRYGGRISGFLLSIFSCFREIVAGWDGRNRVGLHLFQELRDLRGVGSHGDEVLGGMIYFGFRRWRGWRSWRGFAVGQSDIRSKQRHVGTPLSFRLNWVLRSLVGRVT